MVDNPAIHELNNIEVRGGDTDFQVVNIEGTSEDILLEYNDATEEWDIRGTVSDLDVADLEYEFGLHQTEINEDKQIPEGQGSVIAGPLTGTGEITGEGNLAVVDDVQDAVRNPVQENVDFNSNNATGISALEAGSLETGWLIDAVNYESLQDAIDAANLGQWVIAEPDTTYDEDITISTKSLRVAAMGGVRDNVSLSQNDVTIEGRGAIFEGFNVEDSTINVNDRQISLIRVYISRSAEGGGITVSDDEVEITGCDLVDITLESGTEDGTIVGNRRVTVTDNGDNEVLGNT